MSCFRIFTALTVVAMLGWPASLQAQYSQMGAPNTWGGGGFSGGYGGGGYGGGFTGGYSGFQGGYGGGFGGFNPANLSLIARQSEPVHGQVADLLNQLRSMQGPQVAVTTPFNTVNDNFYERIGVGFGFDINAHPFNPNGGSQVVGLLPDGSINPAGTIQFRQGGVFSALPQFGGNDPASNANVGAAILGNQGALYFNLFAGQGSTRSFTTQAPTVMLYNGRMGTFSDTSQTPFVTGLIPVVGGGGLPRFPVPQPTIYYPLRDKIRQYQAQRQQQAEDALNGGAAPVGGGAGGLAGAGAAAPSSPAFTVAEPELTEADKLSLKAIESRGSTAGHGDLSVSEIKRRRAAEQAAKVQAADAQVLESIERGRGAEAAGKPNVAILHYKLAASRAEGELKRELLAKIQELEKN